MTELLGDAPDDPTPTPGSDPERVPEPPATSPGTPDPGSPVVLSGLAACQYARATGVTLRCAPDFHAGAVPVDVLADLERRSGVRPIAVSEEACWAARRDLAHVWCALSEADLQEIDRWAQDDARRVRFGQYVGSYTDYGCAEDQVRQSGNTLERLALFQRVPVEVLGRAYRAARSRRFLSTTHGGRRVTAVVHPDVAREVGVVPGTPNVVVACDEQEAREGLAASCPDRHDEDGVAWTVISVGVNLRAWSSPMSARSAILRRTRDVWSLDGLEHDERYSLPPPEIWSDVPGVSAVLVEVVRRARERPVGVGDWSPGLFGHE